jgi:thymidylate synthase
MQQYHDLLKEILELGTLKTEARAGMPYTLSIFGHQSRYDLSEGFPVLTTKKMFWKGIVAELLWFLRGDVNIKYLDENGARKMWHQDSYIFYIKKFEAGTDPINPHKARNESYSPLTFEDFCKTISDTPREQLPSHNDYTLGDCGYQYGKVWRKWKKDEFSTLDQIEKVIKSIQANPMGRRHIVTAIDPVHDQDLALYWCHAMFQFNCRPLVHDARMVIYIQKLKSESATHEELETLFKDEDATAKTKMDAAGIPLYRLDLHLLQRSGDSFLGVPYNLSSYSLLTYIVAKLCNMIPGEFIHTLSDVHIYENHMEAVHEQLKRDVDKYPLPNLKFADTIDWDYIKSTLDFSRLSVEDITLDGYQSYPTIVAELSTGMKK